MKKLERKVDALVRLCMAQGKAEEGAAKRELAQLVGDGIRSSDRSLRYEIGKILRDLGVPAVLEERKGSSR